MMKATDVAWVAGLFEGEGTIGIVEGGSYARVRLNMTDRDIVERLADFFPSKIRRSEPAREGYRAQYSWGLGNAVRVRQFLHLMMPYFGSRRKAKACEAIEYLESRPRATFGIPHIPVEPASPRDQEIAWVAGLFEGEGCLYYYPNKNSAGSAGVGVKMTDLDVIERLQAFMPCPRIRPIPKTQERFLTQYQWSLTHGDRVREFLTLTMPYMGERRLAKAQGLLSFLDSRPGMGARNRRVTHCPSGHEYTPENTYRPPKRNIRICKACRRAYRARTRQRTS